MRQRFIYVDGVAYEAGTEPSRDSGRSGPTVQPDLPDFRSPIDGTIVRGRAGLRDHCARHDVVPTADLAGLPPKPAVSSYQPDSKAIRDQIILTMRQKKLL